MKTLDLQQGTPEWAAFRAAHHGASEAPAMMGASANLKRSELVRLKATGSERDVSRFTEEVVFARGHEVEAVARAIAEKIIGEELYPATGESDEHSKLSASFDGITMDERTVWECKQFNATKARLVRESQIVPEEDAWQCVQQLLVSGAARLLYMITDGTEENTVHCWMSPDDSKARRLLDGWAQFDKDVAAYQPDPEAQIAVGRAPEALPALLISVTGSVTQSNLPEFKERAIAVFRGINTNLQTDSDFADAEKTVKFCADIEERLKAAKQHALGQTASIDAMFRALDEISAEARTKRLELDKLVKGRKETIRAEIIAAGDREFRAHCDTINARLARARLPAQTANFAGVIRGLKTVASIKDAVATELARMKIDTNRIAEDISANLKTVDEVAKDHQFLTRDLQDLVTINPQHLRGVLQGRIAEYEAEQQRKREADEARKALEQPRQTINDPPVVASRDAMAVAMGRTAEPKPRMRVTGPTEAQIVHLVAKTYGVTEAIAMSWLSHMKFELAAA